VIARHTRRPAERIRRARARLAWLAAVAIAIASGCGGTAQEQPKKLLLISLDTLRPDMLGCYGYPRESSPALDRIAAEGALFENAFTTAPWTLPAHASLLTGVYPGRHGAIGERNAIADGVETLATRLVERGFRTAAFVNSFYVSRRYGFARGFQEFQYVPETSAPAGDGMFGRALVWLAAEPRDRFFLFLHDFQVHSDYRSLPAFEQAFTRAYAGPFTGRTAELLAVREGMLVPTQRDVDHLRDLYVAGIRQLDEEISVLRAFLEGAGLWERTLVVVTSDHGEEFLEHGGVLHGRTQYDEMLRIPLILRGPGVPEGARIARPVSIVDVVPTVLALLGEARPAGIDGVDLFASDGSQLADAERLLFGEADHANHVPDITRSARGARFKLILDRSSGEHALYDLAVDPRERQDVKAANADTAKRLVAELERFESTRSAGPALPATPLEIRKQLEALGYVER
jgi:arylsulfatase A-like enzyme